MLCIQIVFTQKRLELLAGVLETLIHCTLGYYAAMRQTGTGSSRLPCATKLRSNRLHLRLVARLIRFGLGSSVRTLTAVAVMVCQPPTQQGPRNSEDGISIFCAPLMVCKQITAGQRNKAQPPVSEMIFLSKNIAISVGSNRSVTLCTSLLPLPDSRLQSNLPRGTFFASLAVENNPEKA